MNSRILTAILAAAIVARPALSNELLSAESAAAQDGGTRELIVVPGPLPSPQPSPTGPLPTIPSGTVPAPCLTYKQAKQYAPLLDCYLNHPDNSLVANFIQWETPGQDPRWMYWSASRKAELSDAFAATIAWRDSGMQTYPGVQAPAMPANIEAARVMQGVHDYTILDPNDIWRIYRAQIALLLAMEIYSWVPWSFKSYLLPGDSTIMTPLFDLRMGIKKYLDANGNYVVAGMGPTYTSTPGNPLMIYRFLVNNGLIGLTRATTIERILNWGRWNLAHSHGNFTSENANHHWQYWGEPPVQQVLTGTYTTMPGLPNEAYAQAYHWTEGCYGTRAFLIEVFQVVNIPVTAALAGPHATVLFAGERKYMSHGDDPYGDFAKSTRAVSAFLIDPAKFALWFPAGSGSELNVGRAVMDDNIYYPSPALITMHQKDVQDGRTHAASRVYDVYKKWYSVAELEQKGLWTRLDSKLQ